MVFIHWGAFIAGASRGGYIGPEYFMDKDVVLVTFNYRLGPFGFLSTIDDEAPGNYGLKDQVLALKWVQRNIENFGGNKDNVTIFGQSAGAGSVHYHLLSPASKGLFHRAISQSGSALAAWAMTLNDVQKQVTVLQAKSVGCENSTDNKMLIECLRNVPAEDIMRTQDYFRTFFGNPLVIYGAVVETESERNPQPFFTKTPLEYILSGQIEKVPWITGVVKNEGVLRAPSLIRSSEAREALNKNFEKLLTEDLLGLQLSTVDTQSLYKNISKFYFNGKEQIDLADLKTVQGFIDVYSDRAFFYPLYQSLFLHYKVGHKPIYLYSFEYKGTNSYGDLFAGTKEDIDYEWGVCHCDELLYLFNSTDLIPSISNWSDALMSRMLLTLWTNFAKYGNPNPIENSVHANLNWKPLNLTTTDHSKASEDLQFLNITGSRATGPKLEISTGFYQERIKFWTDCDIFENSYFD
ncbi:juvenile hormone esterase-like isoform X2 [Anthonomus grandis grandis]|nr:juvenile hormone esterase-like isoform X2 [Anthonomus grandis grandis]